MIEKKWSTSLWMCNILAMSFGMTYHSKSETCEPIQLPMCQHMPYNMTRMPNLLHHSSQENAKLAIEQFQPLLEQNCSEVLLFFLCAMYAPICTVNFQKAPIPPCRSVCEKAREGCERIVNDHNISWPDYLDCSHLPRYDRGVCVSPEAIVSSTSKHSLISFFIQIIHNYITLPFTFLYYGPYPPRPEIETNKIPARGTDNNGTRVRKPTGLDPRRRICRCNSKKTRPKRKKFKQGKYAFVIRGRIQQQGIVNNVNTVSRVTVTSVFKNKVVPIVQGTTVDLWTNSTCVCPKLLKHKEYLLIGHEDPATKRLLFLDNSLATIWKPKWEKRIKKWTRKKGRKRCSRRRRKGKKCRKRKGKVDNKIKKRRKIKKNKNIWKNSIGPDMYVSGTKPSSVILSLNNVIWPKSMKIIMSKNVPKDEAEWMGYDATGPTF
ncbi:hypothetical protein FSP39_023440 [Pinctada imbricata]|uniref:Secreted frizzled-related protein 3 n=1 Tax=Pinctada imbricata TaxID=66713 RepID=A0AA88YFI6_PINIB|nr:hypothetical protein FSP39_023440 [Pinctada imbricata]